MDDVFFRLALIGAALAVALSFAWYRQRLDRKPGRPVPNAALTPGVYLFASRSCGTCAAARRALEARLGAGGYIEYVWEEQPALFRSIGVEEVPAVMVVAPDGLARLFAGEIDAALAGR